MPFLCRPLLARFPCFLLLFKARPLLFSLNRDLFDNFFSVASTYLFLFHIQYFCHVLLEGHQSELAFFQHVVLDFLTLVLLFAFLRRASLPVFVGFQLLPIFGVVLEWYRGIEQLFLQL